MFPLIVFCLLLSAFSVNGSTHIPSETPLVPVIIWGPNNISHAQRPSSALRRNHTDAFQAVLAEIVSQNPLDQQRVFVYVRDVLSPKDYRDIGSGGGLNLREMPWKLFRTDSAIVFPGVDQPASRLAEWVKIEQTNRLKRSSGSALEPRSDSTSAPNVGFYTHSHPTPTTDDKFWHHFDTSVKANRQATWLIYTANNTLKETVSSSGSRRPPKHEKSLNTFLDASVDGHVLLFFNNLSLIVAPSSNVPPVVTARRTTDDGAALTPIAHVRPNFIDYEMNAPPHLNFRLRSNAHNWFVENVTIGGIAVRPSIDIRAPHMHSYTCPSTIRFFGKVRDDYGVDQSRNVGGGGVVYELRGLRLQPNFGEYLKDEMKASRRTTTCIGYFTVGILSVLLVVALLVVVIFVVIGCILDIRVCDRFDKR